MAYGRCRQPFESEAASTAAADAATTATAAAVATASLADQQGRVRRRMRRSR